MKNDSPNIVVDTAKLRLYAYRLNEVNAKLSRIDSRMDSLYSKVGLRDLLKLLQADIMTGPSRSIKNCSKYLMDTADDFDTTERRVVDKL